MLKSNTPTTDPGKLILSIVFTASGMFMFLSALQYAIAAPPIYVAVVGKTISATSSHPANAQSAISDIPSET